MLDYKFNKNDLILIILMLGVTVILTIYIGANKQEGEYVVITVADIEYARYNLNEDTVINVDIGENTECVVCIEDGRVYMKNANCTSNTCVKHGKIKYKGETIVCIPNKVIIEIMGNNNYNVDAIAR